MDSEKLLPVATLVLGWALGRAEEYFSRRRATRAGVRRAVADLLELHHILVTRKTVFDELSRQFQLSSIQSRAIKEFSGALLQPDVRLHERFNAALDILAGEDPELAFRLRSRDNLPKLLHYFSTVKTESEQFGLFMDSVERELVNAAIPTLKEAILSATDRWDLWLLHRALKRRLSAPYRSPVELDAFVKSIREQLAALGTPLKP